MTDETGPTEGRAPTTCAYCDGTGSCDGYLCGFCEEGVPLDTQADWDASWGALFGGGEQS